MERSQRAKAARMLRLIPNLATLSIPGAAGVGDHRRPEKVISVPIAVSIIPMEPVASPKVSCLGKIKQKKKAAKAPKKPGGLAALMCGGAIGRMFRRRVGPSGSPTSCREAAEEDEAEKRFPPAQPAIGWRKEESSGQRLEDLPGGAVVPVPKQEVNLWRRRGMAQPIPLQVARR